MSNHETGASTPEESATGVATNEPLELATVAPPETEERETIVEPRRKLKWGRWVIGGIIVIVIGVAWMNKDRFMPPPPIPSNYEAFGNLCSADATRCRGAVIKKTDGTFYFFDGSENDAREVSAMIQNRYAGVEDIILFTDSRSHAAIGEMIGVPEAPTPEAERVQIPPADMQSLPEETPAPPAP